MNTFSKYQQVLTAFFASYKTHLNNPDLQSQFHKRQHFPNSSDLKSGFHKH